jgi:branched-chain amino acid transport system ATP-binding protein
MSDSTVLKVEGLVAGYGGAPVIDGMSLQCTTGQLVAVLGANGAGKSTCLKAITGLIRAKAGRITLDGADLTGLDAPTIVKRGVVMVPEGRALFPTMDVRDNLLVGAFLYRRDKARVSDDLERVFALFPRLAERFHQDVATLSGGEQQMVAVARALMARPSVLLLDEPSLGLAPIVFQQLMDEIVALRQNGTPIVLVEQNARMTLRHADYVYVVERGRVIAEGEPTNDDVQRIVEAGYLAGGAQR